MNFGSILEGSMMICWGISWPFQVAKTYRTKNVKGKSILFIWLVLIGYILGITYKLFYHYDCVIWLYILNSVFVGADMVLYYSYKNRPNS